MVGVIGLEASNQDMRERGGLPHSMMIHAQNSAHLSVLGHLCPHFMFHTHLKGCHLIRQHLGMVQFKKCVDKPV